MAVGLRTIAQPGLPLGDGEALARTVTVAELTSRIRRLLQSDDLLSDVYVRGELSNFKRHASGHLYFTLKDEGAQLKCAMFRREAATLTFLPEDGARVICHGGISVYDKQGQYQLYVDSMRFDGVGALFEQFERLKQKLEAEGLFDPARKRLLPGFPLTIGIATSTTGAAIRDLITIIRRRSPCVKVLVIPTVVQGPDAPFSIVRSITLASRRKDLDVLIVGRGGGSIEDLWGFNDERVARAAVKSRIPIVSAVGHETDFTILDFVADARAPTPSAAAALVAPDCAELLGRLRMLNLRMRRSLASSAQLQRHRLKNLLSRRILVSPLEMLTEHRQALDEMWENSFHAVSGIVRSNHDAVSRISGQLMALDPRAVLRRGYSIFRYPDGSVISAIKQAQKGSEAEVVLQDGSVMTTIQSTQEDPLGPPLSE